MDGLAGLSGSDARRILDAQTALEGRQRGMDGYASSVLAALHLLYPHDIVAVNQVVFEDPPRIRIWADPPSGLPVGAAEILVAYAHQHPILSHVQRTGDRRILQMSDFAGLAQLRSSELWEGVFAPVGITDQLVATFAVGVTEIGLSVQRDGRGFSDRERTILAAARPRFADAFAAALNYDRACTLEEALHVAGLGIVVVGDDSQILAASDLASDTLGRWYPDEASDRLAAPVAEWLARLRRPGAAGQGTPKQLLVEAAGRRLTVRHLGTGVGGDLLEFSEPRADGVVCRLRELGVSPRQAAVLDALASGLPPAQAARQLAITRATLHKHLERAYRTLGVNHIGAALALAHGVSVSGH